MVHLRLTNALRILTLIVLISFFLLGSNLRPSCAAGPNDYLFPLAVSDDDKQWLKIAPSEAIQLLDEAAAMRSKHGTGRAQLLIYRAHASIADDLLLSDRDAIIGVLREIKESESPQVMRNKTASIVRHRPEDITQKLNWSEVTITEDGDDVIESSEKWSDNTWPSTCLSTHKIKIVYEGAMNQADIALPGRQNRMRVNRLDSYCIVLPKVKEQSIRSAATTPDYVKLVLGSINRLSQRSIIFSRRDGGVLYDSYTSRAGKLAEETWQGPMKEWAGGVLYPTSMLRCKYMDGALTDVEAIAVKHAEFNVRVEPSEFVVAIPAGTTVVDARDGEPTAVRIKEPIDDLAYALEAGLFGKLSRTKTDLANVSSTARWKIVLVLLNVVVIAVLVLVLVIRRRIRGAP